MTDSERLFIQWARNRWLAGKSTAEIAQEMNISEAYVYNRLDKIRRKGA